MAIRASTEMIADTNREIAAFAAEFRRFFRGEDRSNLQSVLFNVPGRLVAGCWADYENMGEVFRELLALVPAENIGRQMKKPAARPGIFQITCLLVSYLIARQQEILLRKKDCLAYSDDRHLEEIHILFDAGRKILGAARNDGGRFPSEKQHTMPLLDDVAQREVVDRLSASSAQEIAWRRRAWAALTAYNFLFHGEMRDGIFNHGPYDLGGGRFLLVKELTELHNGFFPWAVKVHKIPTGLVRALILEDVRFHFDVLGGVATQPITADDRIVADGIFEVSGGKLVTCDEVRLNKVLDLVAENTQVLYQEFGGWDEAVKIRYGTLLHANFLRGFWEMTPKKRRSELARRTMEGYERSGEEHFGGLSTRQHPLIMQHIAHTRGPIFSPLQL